MVKSAEICEILMLGRGFGSRNARKERKTRKGEGDSFGFAGIEVAPEEVDERFIGGCEEGYPSSLACLGYFPCAGAACSLFNDLFPDGGGDGDLSVEGL